MKSIYDSRQLLKYVFIFTAILIAIASVVVSDSLIKNLAQEERQKIEVWADATRLIASEDAALDMSLVLKIIQGNTSIPVVLCNDKDSILDEKNIEYPEKDVEAFKKAKVEELKSKNTIVIDIGDGTYQYVYYIETAFGLSLCAAFHCLCFYLDCFPGFGQYEESGTEQSMGRFVERNSPSVGDSHIISYRLGGIS